MLDKVVLVAVHLDLIMVEQPVMVHKEILEEVHRKPEVVPVVEEVEVMQVTEDKVMVVVQVGQVVHTSHMVVQLDFHLAVEEVVRVTTTYNLDLVVQVDKRVEVLLEQIQVDSTQQVEDRVVPVVVEVK
jgi:hypothetical protein